MRDRVDAATSALEQTPPAVEKARTLLKEGEKLITLRQKNILIADRSEHQSARRGKNFFTRLRHHKLAMRVCKIWNSYSISMFFSVLQRF